MTLLVDAAQLMLTNKSFFFQSIDTQTSILNATVLQRQKFIELISQEVRLEHVEITHWAGLGGVRYIPSEFIDKKGEEVDAVSHSQGSRDPRLDHWCHLHSRSKSGRTLNKPRWRTRA